MILSQGPWAVLMFFLCLCHGDPSFVAPSTKKKHIHNICTRIQRYDKQNKLVEAPFTVSSL